MLSVPIHKQERTFMERTFMDTSIHDVAMFKALGDETRIKVLMIITKASRTLTVSEITRQAGLKLSTVSDTLQKLKSTQIVTMTRSGKERLYALSPTLSERLFASARFFTT